VLLPLTASGQEWDKSDTQTITISNKLSARYQPYMSVGEWALPTILTHGKTPSANAS
jgi:hypothetical protein